MRSSQGAGSTHRHGSKSRGRVSQGSQKSDTAPAGFTIGGGMVEEEKEDAPEDRADTIT